MADKTVTDGGIEREGSSLTRRKFLIGSGGVVGGAMVSGAGYQGIGTAQDKRQYPPPGELVSVGTYRIHLNLMGSEHPGLTVILEAGAGDFSLAWYGFQERIAEFAPVVSSDRAGLGWSDPSSEPRSAGKAADELYSALRTANIPGPYILVGHSYGGGVMRLFAHRYPEVVAGLVLVDSSDEIVAVPPDALLAAYRAIGVTAHFGVLRLAAALGALPILPAYRGVSDRGEKRLRTDSNWAETLHGAQRRISEHQDGDGPGTPRGY